MNYRQSGMKSLQTFLNISGVGITIQKAIQFSCMAFASVGIANAQLSQTGSEGTILIETRYSTDVLFHVDGGGVLRDMATGAILTKAQAEAKVNMPGPFIVGIIIGAGQGAAGALLTGGGAREILFSAFGGAAGGYYGALAHLTTRVVRIFYGSTAIVVASGSTVVTKKEESTGGSGGSGSASNGGPCTTEEESPKCTIHAQ
jgi:hypothetical protein